MERIRALHDQGQSIWFDFIERSMLQFRWLAGAG